MRGYFLVFMLINHLIFAGGYWLVEINHRQFAFVEDAQGFVFLSGLLIGMIYARKMARQGYAAGRDLIWGRAFELYRYAMGTVFVILVTQMLLPNAYRIWGNWLAYSHFDDPLRLALIGGFLFQPTFMDILPQYIVYMLFAPLAVRLCIEGRAGSVVAASLLLWTAAQLGLHRLVTEPVNEWMLRTDGEPIRASFNLLGWQMVFFGGLVAGALTSTGRIDWQRIFKPQDTLIPRVALTICLFFLPLRVLTAHDLLPHYMLDKFATMEIRADFGPVYAINFIGVALLIAWLLIAGPRHEKAWVRKAASLLAGLFSLRYLRLLGRHSLHIYVWHVLIVYMVYYLDGRTPMLSQLTKTTIAAVALALLALPALWRERDRLLGRPDGEIGKQKLR